MSAAVIKWADITARTAGHPAPINLRIVENEGFQELPEKRFAVALPRLRATNPMTQWARWNLQTVRDWSFAREARAQLKARWAEFFNQYDALLCPISNVPPIPHDDSPEPALRTIMVNGRSTPYLNQSVWSGLATVADLPAVAVPAGMTPTNLPVGIQVVAPYLEDRTAIDIGRHIERVVGRLTRS